MRHIIALSVGLEYNLFYDEAELDLETFLEGGYHPHYPDSALAPQALVSQVWYLAGAVDFLHSRLVDRRTRILCCHMDLKPATILIVRDKSSPVGKWMLSDFGIAVVRTESQSGHLAADMYGDEGQTTASVTRSTRHPSEYQPPEVERSIQMSYDSEELRKGDIWSLGCILVELLLFSIGGAPLVKKLNEIKQSESQTGLFYLTMASGVRPVHKVKDSIKSWAAQISYHQGPWAFEWFKLVFDAMLQISPIQRPEAKQIQDYLDLVWKQAPPENIWGNTATNLDVRPVSSGWAETSGRRPSASSVSFRSSRRPSADRSSTPEVAPATAPGQDLNRDPLMAVREAAQVDFAPLSHRRSDSTEGTISSGSAQGFPTDEMNLRGDLPDADDLAICSDAARIVFWNGQNIIPFNRNSGFMGPELPPFACEISDVAKIGLKSKDPDEWIHASLSGSYLALVKSCPSAIHVSIFRKVY
jgi:serine/threonine protein kinase